jgi:hypothetical protein
MHRSRRTASQVIDFFDEHVQQPPTSEEKNHQQGNEHEKQNAAAVYHAQSKLSVSGFARFHNGSIPRRRRHS